MSTPETRTRHMGSLTAIPSRALVRALGRAAVAALVVFHLWLLASQILGSRGVEPQSAARWGVAALAVAGFRALRRRRLSVVSSRHAVALWLLVLIIHGSAAMSGDAVSLERRIPAAAMAATGLAALATFAGFAAVSRIAPAPRPRAERRTGVRIPRFVGGLPSSGAALRFSPRPPPLA